MTENLFDISGKRVLVTGGGGILGGAMADELGRRGARVAVLDRNLQAAQAKSEEIRAAGGESEAIACDVLDRESLAKAADKVSESLGGADILINGAGGNQKGATTSEELSFFDLPEDALRLVTELNLFGSIYPSQVFGRMLRDRGEGVIINISSMNSFRPLTRIVGYSAAKAAINNFTQWLAVHLAREYSPRIRVNAIAPGFFETQQNKFLLRNEDGSLTARGQQIIDHTPAGRFGDPQDLFGTLLWLISPAAEFVSGIVVPVDGGFSAFSGV